MTPSEIDEFPSVQRFRPTASGAKIPYSGLENLESPPVNFEWQQLPCAWYAAWPPAPPGTVFMSTKIASSAWGSPGHALLLLPKCSILERRDLLRGRREVALRRLWLGPPASVDEGKGGHCALPRKQVFALPP